MTSIPIATSDWRRGVAEEPVIKLQNRFFEQNPTNLVEGSSLISRPGFKYFTDLGTAGTLSMYSQEATFDNNLFVLASSVVNRVRSDGTSIDTVGAAQGYAGVRSHNNLGSFTSSIGDIPPYFYFSGGAYSLWVVGETTFASGTLSWNPGIAIANGAVIQLGGVYYEITNTGVDTGSPAGTSANPWKVRNSGIDPSFTMANLRDAVLVRGQPGIDYSSATAKNPFVNSGTLGIGSLVFYANTAGLVGNTVSTAKTGDSNVNFSGPTLTGGGLSNQPNSAHQVTMPDSILGSSIQAVATIGGYVLVAVQNLNSSTAGRFYWIEPGETWVDPLNFATAELSPDSLISIRVIGDQIWMIGTGTLEVWSLTGDADFPFRRVQGRTFNLGVAKGSDQVIQDVLVFIGSDGLVYQASGNSLNVISDPSVSERIKRFISSEDFNDFSIRSWTFDSDGHIFYLLNLGSTPALSHSTLCYDLSTQMWYQWSHYGVNGMRQHGGCKWPSFPGVPCVVGDPLTGVLWFTDPDYRFDDSVEVGVVTLIPTVFTAGVPMRMRETSKTNELYLTGSVGSPNIEFTFLVDGDGFYLVDGDGFYLADVEPRTDFLGDPNSIFLEISDDNGKTWFSVSGVTIEKDQWSQEIVWRSLGLIKAPGRIFRFTDYNAMKRIDGLDMR